VVSNLLAKLVIFCHISKQSAPHFPKNEWKRHSSTPLFQGLSLLPLPQMASEALKGHL
jgi:hypothetical protein